MRKVWLIIVLAMISPHLSSQDEGDISALSDQVSRFGQAEIVFDLPDREKLDSISSKISVYKIKDKKVFAVISIRDISYMEYFPLQYNIIDRNNTKSVQSALSVEEAMNWDKYPSYQQYDSILHKLTEDYPSLCRLEIIGESVNGHKVFVLKISDNVDMDEGEPQVFYSSTMHGDELVGYVLMLRLAEHLLANAGGGGLEQQLVDSLEIWINPLANPDGTYNLSDTIISPKRSNANGLDLNRCFPDPDLGVYEPVAEAKENIDMVAFLKNHSFVISANFHSGVEVVNFPWDKWYDPRLHADHSWFEKISRSYADTVHKYSPDPFYFTDFDDGVTHGSTWLRITGGRQDYVTYERQGREVTIELDETKQTPASDLHTFWNDNYRSLLNYLANAFYGIHGRVVDNDTGLPLEAKIFVQGHDVDSSHVYSEAFNGSFVRLIDEGLWSLAVSADGYETLYLENVQVVANQQTSLDIRLVPTGTGIDDTNIDDLKIWPVPAGDMIYLNLPEENQGSQFTVSVYNINGSEVIQRTINSNTEFIIEIPVSTLPAGIYLVKIKPSGSKRTLAGKFIKN